MKAGGIVAIIALITTIYFSGWFGSAGRVAGMLAGQQTQSGAQAPVAPTPEAVAQNDNGGTNTQASRSKQDVDETALRYFARQGDTKRLEAEIARLKAIYPDWTPPADPLAIEIGDPQLDAMWKLYADGKYAELRTAIADRLIAEPDWQVPDDLRERLAAAESRMELVEASDAKDFARVVELGAANPGLLTCGDIDVLWRVAEAFASTDRMDRAKDAYLYMLSNCENTAERLATVQKASLVVPRPVLEELFSKEKKDANGVGEFAALRPGIARQAVAASNADPSRGVVPGDLKLLEELANKEGLASDSLLLGWHYIGRKDYDRSEQWFRKAYEIEKSAESAQGVALSLVDLDRPSEAEDILYEWRDTSDDVRAVYLAAVTNMLAADPLVPVDEKVLRRLVPVVYQAKNFDSAQQLGWYADAFNQFETAEEWFATALGWKPDDEPSAYGLTLMRWKLKDSAGVKEMQREWAGRSERIATVGQPEKNGRGRRQIQNEIPSPRPRAAVHPDDEPTDRPGIDPITSGSTVGSTTAHTDAPQQLPAVVVAQADMQETSSTMRSTSRSSARATGRGCATTVAPARLSPDTALNRGWCLMEMNRPAEAAQAFEVALGSNSEKTRGDAAYGQSLAYLRLGLGDEAAVAATKAPQTNTRSVELQTALLSDQATSAFEARRYQETLIALDALEQIAPQRVDLLVLRGYAYLNLKRYGEAERIFRAAAATGDKEARKGLAAVRDAKAGSSGLN